MTRLRWFCAGYLLLPLVSCRAFAPDRPRVASEELEAAISPMLHGDRYDPEEVTFRVEAVAHDFPDDVAAQMASAALAYRSGETAKAQFYLERVLALEAAHPDAVGLRVRIAIDDGNLGLSRQLVGDALRLRPDAAELHETDAWVRHLDGDDTGALAALENAERLGSPAWRVAFNRGVVFEGRDDLDRAAHEYRVCLAGNRDYEPARRRLAGMGRPVRGQAERIP